MNDSNMIKLWLYELGWVVATFLGFSLTDINQYLQTALYILGIISALLAIRETIKRKKHEK